MSVNAIQNGYVPLNPQGYNSSSNQNNGGPQNVFTNPKSIFGNHQAEAQNSYSSTFAKTMAAGYEDSSAQIAYNAKTPSSSVSFKGAPENSAAYAANAVLSKKEEVKSLSSIASDALITGGAFTGIGALIKWGQNGFSYTKTVDSIRNEAIMRPKEFSKNYILSADVDNELRSALREGKLSPELKAEAENIIKSGKYKDAEAVAQKIKDASKAASEGTSFFSKVGKYYDAINAKLGSWVSKVTPSVIENSSVVKEGTKMFAKSGGILNLAIEGAMESGAVYSAFDKGGFKEGIKGTAQSAVKVGASVTGYAAGAWVGAKIGAAAGSLLGPVGAMVGGAVGMIAGGIFASDVAKEIAATVVGKNKYGEEESSQMQTNPQFPPNVMA